MAELVSEIKISMEVRPCIVNECKALFHRWSEHADVIGPSLLKGGHNGGEVRYTVAIVEFEDGSVAEVWPRDIRFLDHPHENYIFTEREEKESEQETV